MTPLEKALERQGKVMTCLDCENSIKVGGAWYCKANGKMLHPYCLECDGKPMKCEHAKLRVDGEAHDQPEVKENTYADT